MRDDPIRLPLFTETFSRAVGVPESLAFGGSGFGPNTTNTTEAERQQVLVDQHAVAELTGSEVEVGMDCGPGP